MKLKGKITISRTSSNRDNDLPMNIEVTDDSSGTRFLNLRMSMEAFAACITGQGCLGCEFELMPDRVGMKREAETRVLPLVDLPYKGREEAAAEILKQYETDGWKGRVSDYTNHNNVIRGPEPKVSVTFIRYV